MTTFTTMRKVLSMHGTFRTASPEKNMAQRTAKKKKKGKQVGKLSEYGDNRRET